MSRLSSAGLHNLAEVAASHIGPDRVPGLVALVAAGDDVHVEALGAAAGRAHRPAVRGLRRVALNALPGLGYPSHVAKRRAQWWAA